MLPAMLAIPPTVSRAAAVQSPSKGQISSPVSASQLDPIAISMDHNRGLNFGFGAPHPSPSFSGKPSSGAGLSKPRLTKTRRRVPSAAGVKGLGFNPNQSGPGMRGSEETVGSGISSGFESVKRGSYGFCFGRDMGGQSWGEDLSRFGAAVKPERGSFAFEAGSVSNSDAKNICSFGKFAFASDAPGKSDAGDFVFGSGANFSFSSWSSDSNEFSKLPVEMSKLHLEDDQNEEATVGDRSANSSQSANFSLNQASFTKLPDETRKLNLQRSGKEDGSETMMQPENSSRIGGQNAFIFTSGKDVSASLGSGSTMTSLPEKSSDLNQGTYFGSDDGTSLKLSDEMRKLNLEGLKHGQSTSPSLYFGSNACLLSMLPDEMRRPLSSGSENGFPNTNPAVQTSQVDGDVAFVFGSNKDVSSSSCPDEMRKLNLQSSGNRGSSLKAMPVNQSSSADGNNTFIFMSSKNASSSSLPDEMRNLNPQSCDSSFQKTIPIDQSSQANGSNIFVFGSSKNTPSSSLPNEMRKLNLQSDDNRKIFQKKMPVNQSSEADRNSTFVFRSRQKTSSSSLQDEMRKLNLHSSGNGDSSENSKPVDQCSQGYENTFVFGSSERTYNSSLPDEVRKLNLHSSGIEDSSDTTTPVDQSCQDYENEAFVFGDRKNASNSFVGSPFNMLPKEMKSNDRSEKPSASMSHESGDVADGYIFGSKKNISSSIGGNLAKAIPDDVKSSNIGKSDGIKDQVSVTDTSAMDVSSALPAQTGKQNACSSIGDIPPLLVFYHFKSGGVTFDASTPLSFSFQAGEQNTSSSIGRNLPSQSSTHFKPGDASMTSSHLLSTGSGMQASDMEFIFGKMKNRLETEDMECRTPEQTTFSFTTEHMSAGLHQRSEFDMKKGASKGTTLKKRRGKLRLLATFQQTNAKKFMSREKVLHDNLAVESSGSYSPMDFSPYQDTPLPDQYSSREASVASDESIHPAPQVPKVMPSLSVDGREENFAFETQQFDANGSDLKHGLDYDFSQVHFEKNFAGEVGKENFMTRTEGDISLVADDIPTTIEDESGSFILNIDGDANEGRAFIFGSSMQDTGKTNFTFAASSSVRGSTLASKQRSRRIDRTKIGRDSYNFTLDGKISLPFSPKFIPASSVSASTDPAQSLKEIPFSLPEKENHKTDTNKVETRQESISTTATSIAAQEACEKWRLRSCIRVLMLCYSNRAAARMSLGRMREALNDSLMATAIDPNFLKVQVRAANCHLALGETDDAIKHFRKCLQLDTGPCLEPKNFVDASDGLRKAQLVVGYMDQSAGLLLKRKSTDATMALELISEALSISPYSEMLLEMKAEALFMLREYNDVVKLCKQTLDLAEKNGVIIVADRQCKNRDTAGGMKSSCLRPWRWYLTSKAYFYLGKLEEALELLQKHEYGDGFSQLSSSLSCTIRELLRHKAAGNEAFQVGRHLEAVERYTAALTCNIESRPFTAICFCNRAAAYQALGQIIYAIADCSLASALDPGYTKAISRRATLHEMIRDYGQASNDLRRLISQLEKRSGKDYQAGTLGRSNSNASDINRYHLKLSMLEDEAQKETPLDMYLILGVEPSSSAADIKKAYRKAALRHHPDKASQFLVKSETIDDGLWKEVANEVQQDSDRLFKVIQEAYTTLSDPSKRAKYDAKVEMRTALNKGFSGSSTPRTRADTNGYQNEKSSNRRQWREGWKSYGNSH